MILVKMGSKQQTIIKYQVEQTGAPFTGISADDPSHHAPFKHNKTQYQLVSSLVRKWRSEYVSWRRNGIESSHVSSVTYSA